jgi:hypothetical protein
VANIRWGPKKAVEVSLLAYQEIIAYQETIAIPALLGRQQCERVDSVRLLP